MAARLATLVFATLLSSCTDTLTGSGVTGADPGVLEAPIAFVKRPIALDNNGNELQPDLREPLFFVAGGDIYLRSNSTVTATELNITAALTVGLGDVKDLKPSFDGSRLLFSLRLADPDPNDDVLPSWNIYEYDLEQSTLNRIISNQLTAEQGDDIAPAYLPDGRIIFSSNRQRQSGEMLTNEGKPRFRALDEDEDTMAMVLHVMNADGSELHQISFNQSHDLDPIVLSNSFPGEVLFTRWDNAAANNAMHLYRINPDGTGLQVLYGVHSHNTGSNNADTDNATIQFSQVEEMQDGRIMVLTRPFTGTYGGGDLVIIDAENFVNQNQPVFNMIGLPGPAQTSATINRISATDEISTSGRYSAAYPLWDGSNRLLVSKSTCELNINTVRRPCIEPYLSDINAVEASPAYGIWLYDMNNNSEKIIAIAEQGMVMTDIVALQSRPVPAIKSTANLNTTWADAGMGVVHIRSVYDFGTTDGSTAFNGCFLTDCSNAASISTVSDLADPAKATADQRPARFIRLEKAVALPDSNDPALGNDAPDLSRSAFGPARNQGMREIIGYAPVEPDGSVKVKAPANIPLAISVLDRSGRRIGPGHQNWFQLRPGTTLECTGCHSHTTANSVTPNVHHRSDAESPSINSGVPASGVFVNTRIPDTTDIYFGNLGETMAQVRFRLASTEPQLSANISYSDVWTNPDVRPIDTSFSYNYAMLETLPPTSSGCLNTATSWDFKCRIIINYQQHIHPLWSLPRGVADADTCTNCHTSFDATLMIDKAPAAQLDLSDGFSDQEAARYKSYRELFFTDAGQQLDATGTLVNIQIEVPVLDANGDPTFTQIEVPVLDTNGDPVLDSNGLPVTEFINDTPITEFIDDPAARTLISMSGNGARASYFIEKMTETELQAGRSLLPTTDINYVDHSGFLSADELRLISEWLDIGAQYFNNPFDPDAPMN